MTFISSRHHTKSHLSAALGERVNKWLKANLFFLVTLWKDSFKNHSLGTFFVYHTVMTYKRTTGAIMTFILQERVKLNNFRGERSMNVVMAFWLFFVISSVSVTSTLIFSEWGRVSRQRNCLYCIPYISWPWQSASSTQTWTGHWLSNFERFSFKNPWAIHTDMYKLFVYKM